MLIILHNISVTRTNILSFNVLFSFTSVISVTVLGAIHAVNPHTNQPQYFFKLWSTDHLCFAELEKASKTHSFPRLFHHCLFICHFHLPSTLFSGADWGQGGS